MKFGKDLIETNSRDIQLSQDKVTSTFTKANQTATATSTSTEPVKKEKRQQPVKKKVESPVEKKPEPVKAPSPPSQKDLVSDKISSHKKVVYAEGSTIIPNTTLLLYI